MTYEIEINDFGLRDEDGLLELPGKAWILVSIEDTTTFFDGFRIDFLDKIGICSLNRFVCFRISNSCANIFYIIKLNLLHESHKVR